jgi:hypothetical protein
MTSIFGGRARGISDRRTRRLHRGPVKQRFVLEHLEPRTLLTATLSVTAAGAVDFLLHLRRHQLRHLRHRSGDCLLGLQPGQHD